MSTSSTLNSVLSALGGSTGIDVTSAVNAVLYADRAPERAWQSQQSTLASQTSAINQIQNEASTLSDALSSLQSTTGALSAATTSSTSPGVVTATAVAGTPASSHQIVVNNLATKGSWYSDAESSSSTALPSGSFQITVGSTTTTVNVGGSSGVDTLDQLAASINSAALGVSASIVTDSTGARLSLLSTTSGAAGDFSISNSSTVGFTQADKGTDAKITVDGVPVSSAFNIVSGALSGVTLNLQSADPGIPITLNVSPDTTSITSGITSFVSAYNALITDVNSQLSYNSSTNTAGVLQTDSAVQGLQTQLLNDTTFSAGGSVFSTLSQLGIAVNNDGTLSVNSAALNSAIQTNSAAVASFFQGTNGFVATVNTTLNTFTDPTQGAFTVDLQSIASEYKDLSDQIDTLELYLASQQTILTAQYNAADIAIQQLPQKLKQIQALLNPNQNSSSS